MRIEGSCHCGAVRFHCESRAPYPFNYCYCSICRKTGGSGSACNIHADADSLQVEGREHVRVYRAFLDHPEREERSRGERRFCGRCGSPLWVWDPGWPELVHPFAAVVDTPLPTPPERQHILMEEKPAWVPVPSGSRDVHHAGMPEESLMEWHRRHGLVRD